MGSAPGKIFRHDHAPVVHGAPPVEGNDVESQRLIEGDEVRGVLRRVECEALDAQLSCPIFDDAEQRPADPATLV
jgi:hypothetical protein